MSAKLHEMLLLDLCRACGPSMRSPAPPPTDDILNLIFQHVLHRKVTSEPRAF